MGEWEAPAKLNLDLRVGRSDSSGKHPLRSLVQIIDWVDLVTIEEGDEDVLEVEGADLPEGGENLVWRAVEALALAGRPPLVVRLRKHIRWRPGWEVAPPTRRQPCGEWPTCWERTSKDRSRWRRWSVPTFRSS